MNRSSQITVCFGSQDFGPQKLYHFWPTLFIFFRISTGRFLRTAKQTVEFCLNRRDEDAQAGQKQRSPEEEKEDDFAYDGSQAECLQYM